MNPKIPSTIEAAALCKMADRGQITGGVLDGPLALDNAISLEAAAIKQIASPVAGRANVLIAPDLEAANMLVKSLSMLAHADCAGIVLGARVPIILTSRADSVMTRLASCAVASLVAQARRENAARAIAESSRCRRHPGPQRRLVEPQVLAVRRRATRDARCSSRGQIGGIFTTPASSPRIAAGQTVGEKRWGAGEPIGHPGALGHLVDWLRTQLWRRPSPGGRRPSRRRTAAATSRRRSGSTPRSSPRWRSWCRSHRCTSRTTSPRSATLLERDPDVPQIACFDTAMHRTQPLLEQMYALPRELDERGRAALRLSRHLVRVHRRRLPDVDPRAARGKTVVAPPGQWRQHVRAGGGRSIATTMGFTAVDGLPMGTRSGSLDPGVLLYLMDQRGMDARAIESLIYKQSGLLGVSGISSDMRDAARLEGSARARWQSISSSTASRASSARWRRRSAASTRSCSPAASASTTPSCASASAGGAAWLGIELDAEANAAGGPRISTATSRAPPG